MNAQILIKTANDWFEFSKSKTGQLDYVGKWEKNDKPRVDDAQEFISSTYFSPAWYVFIQGELNCNPTVYVAPDVDVSDKDLFDYLVHIGPVLAAVEAKDSLLAGELFLRRREVFEKYTFGSVDLGDFIQLNSNYYDEVYICGVCTDICVISNALLIKAFCPEMPIKVIKRLCAGVTVESHNNAINAMKMCQIEVED